MNLKIIFVNLSNRYFSYRTTHYKDSQNSSKITTSEKIDGEQFFYSKTFHFLYSRNIATKLEWLTNQKGLFAENEASCKFMLKEYLPRGIYVDLDQIKAREEFTGPKVNFPVRQSIAMKVSG